MKTASGTRFKEICRVSDGDKDFVLAVNDGTDDGKPFFAFGADYDVYDGVYGPNVERCGDYDQVRERLAFEIGWGDDFSPVAKKLLAELEKWRCANG